MPVGGGQAGARVDDEQDRVAVDKRRFRLRAHPARKRGRVAFLEAGRVDDGEGKVGEPRLALAAVAGDARLIVDERELAPDEAVEQSRLADVRPADDRDLGAHVISSPARLARGSYFAGAADRFAATRPCQRLAICRSSGVASGSPSTRSNCLAASS